MFKFSSNYFILAILLLAAEIYIGMYVHDSFIRPVGGDFLVVILLYCLVKSFINIKARYAAGAVLLFSYGVETLQYFNIVEKLKLTKYELAKILFGTSFSWLDMLAYTLGIMLVVFVEWQWERLNNKVDALINMWNYKRF
jgi:hypothetical protein